MNIQQSGWGAIDKNNNIYLGFDKRRVLEAAGTGAKAFRLAAESIADSEAFYALGHPRVIVIGGQHVQH